jgi:hypothetical protein
VSGRPEDVMNDLTLPWLKVGLCVLALALLSCDEGPEGGPGGCASGQCFIDGICVDEGTASSDDPCLGCVPSTSDTSWSLLPDGTPCETYREPWQGMGLSGENQRTCQEGTCCSPMWVCFDKLCECDYGGMFGGCYDSECEFVEETPAPTWPEPWFCADECGGDCCLFDWQCSPEAPKCTSYRMGDPGRVCVPEVEVPRCWEHDDCPPATKCEGEEHCDCWVECPERTPGTCISTCGDGACEVKYDEDCSVCPEDCCP